jgi:hypothetical protein
MCARYGTDMDSYYIDMIFDYPYLDMIDRERLRRTLLKHNPQAVIVGNGESNETVDFGSREDVRVYVPNVEERLAYPVQTAVCLTPRWWAGVPSSEGNTAIYSSGYLYRYLVLTAGANVGGGGLVVGASPYVTDGFEPGVKETMVELGSLIVPVAESIMNTLPSVSYITPAGASIRSLQSGIVATRSMDDAHEYIHVLTPPKNNNLTIPLPLDGRRFVDATMLRSGNSATITQDDTGIHFTIPDGWDPLDTVIKMAVASIPSDSSDLITLPHDKITAKSSSELPGYEAARVTDNNPKTFWCTESARSHWIIIDLGKEHRVGKIRVLPRQDGVSSSNLMTHITTYSVHASCDGLNYRPVATGEWKRTPDEKSASFSLVTARYVKLEAGPDWIPDNSRKSPRGLASAREINIEVVTNENK